ncbi:BRO family protein [Cupriavidus sp. D384]|uniref:BRO-N domain-containing protein n=1 Tax=Cupriavidus sp. D384 TaxID=1538095 RepID=UPI00083741E1|nr:BRO family protein [Cupriavidus sp. D384]
MDVPSVFAFDSRAVRVVTGPDGLAWFVATDIASALDFRMASDMVRMLDDDEKGTQIVRTPGGEQEMLLISEAGLYAAVLRSRKEEAKRFKRWVTHEVLPAIRKTGGYQAGPSASLHLAAQALRLRLLDRLQCSRLPAMRLTIYDQLRQLSDFMGLPTPPLDSVSSEHKADPDAVSQLWVALNELGRKSVPYNHARDPQLLAINGPHIDKLCSEHRLVMPPLRQMRRAIIAAPRFIDFRTVNSKLTGRSTKCWVFQADVPPSGA